MLDLEEIRRRLADRRVDAVAQATKLHRNTISTIRDGKQENPTYYVLRRLSDYLEGPK